jgi:hypothetical protein
LAHPQALEYKQRIMAAVPKGSSFTPLMTLYLTDRTTPEDVHSAKAAGIPAFKLYPAGTFLPCIPTILPTLSITHATFLTPNPLSLPLTSFPTLLNALRRHHKLGLRGD